MTSNQFITSQPYSWDLYDDNSNQIPTASISTTSTDMVQVVAPATMPGGYTFEAQLNGQTFNVRVPPGGVDKGQIFSVPHPNQNTDIPFAFPVLPTAPTSPTTFETTTNDPPSSLPKSTTPDHRWKDGFFGCFKYGVFHPMLWNAWCCPAIALAQVMTRMNLTWIGHPGNQTETNKTFQKVVYVLISFFVFDTFLFLTTTPENVLREIVQLIFCIYLAYAMTKTRTFIRTKYNIEGNACKDCCLSIWCTCCTVAQMGRHTTDYDVVNGQCCTKNGLSEHVNGVGIV